MEDKFPVLIVGGKRLWDIQFFCALCGPRYWQVPEGCDEPMKRAIREEAEWHGDNIHRYGFPWPVGIEPIFGVI